MREKKRHVFRVKFNMTMFLIIIPDMAPQLAIHKASEVADRDLIDPQFHSCEYVGEEDN